MNWCENCIQGFELFATIIPFIILTYSQFFTA